MIRMYAQQIWGEFLVNPYENTYSNTVISDLAEQRNNQVQDTYDTHTVISKDLNQFFILFYFFKWERPHT